MTAAPLELHALQKSFPGFDLGPLSLAFEPARVHGLLGPNGAGKTTLLNVLALQTRMTSGGMTYAGQRIMWGDARWKERVAYVRETPSFYGELTVEETLRLAARLYGRWDAGLASHMTRRLGLKDQQRVSTLSKGTRVKLGIAAALAQRAELLMLDEPTAGVDPTAREELHDILKDLRRDRPELCVLLSSHIFEDLETSADNVLILRNGQVAFQTSREQLAAMSLYRIPGTAHLPTSSDVPLAWASDGHAWVMTPKGSVAGLRLRAIPGCVEETSGSLLAAAYRGTGKIAAQQAK